MKLQGKSQWILFGVFLVLLIKRVMYTTVFRQDKPRAMKNALPVQTPENMIKHVILQELLQQKETRERTTDYKYTGTFLESKLFIVKKSNVNWKVALEGDALIREFSQQILDAMMNTQEKKTFSVLGDVQAPSHEIGLNFGYLTKKGQL